MIVSVFAGLFLVLAACGFDQNTLPRTSSKTSKLVTLSTTQPSIVIDGHSQLKEMTRATLTGTTLVNTSNGQELLTLLVACALRNDQSITVPQADNDLLFLGEAGLAPDWANGPLNEEGQHWVSACVLSHLNNENVTVPISMRGTNCELTPDQDEKQEWPVEEGAFFGNIFTSANKPIQWNACKGTGQVTVERTCARPDPSRPGLTLCGFVFAGDCVVVCKRHSEHYDSCLLRNHKFREVITVFVTN